MIYQYTILIQEAIERSKQELLLNGSDESNKCLGVMEAQPMPVSHETRQRRDLTIKETGRLIIR